MLQNFYFDDSWPKTLYLLFITDAIRLKQYRINNLVEVNLVETNVNCGHKWFTLTF